MKHVGLSRDNCDLLEEAYNRLTSLQHVGASVVVTKK